MCFCCSFNQKNEDSSSHIIKNHCSIVWLRILITGSLNQLWSLWGEVLARQGTICSQSHQSPMVDASLGIGTSCCLQQLLCYLILDLLVYYKLTIILLWIKKLCYFVSLYLVITSCCSTSCCSLHKSWVCIKYYVCVFTNRSHSHLDTLQGKPQIAAIMDPSCPRTMEAPPGHAPSSAYCFPFCVFPLFFWFKTCVTLYILSLLFLESFTCSWLKVNVDFWGCYTIFCV
jgi:hypothetical protein